MVASSSMQDVMKEIGTRARLRALTEELAELTGASAIDVVLHALEDRLARVTGPSTREERLGKVLAILRGSSRFDGDGPVPSRREQDRTLGYGKEGV